jgi:hypothetical protein
MKLLVQSAMIFFGTLMAAGLVALGEPARANESQSAAQGASIQALNHLVESARPWVELTTAGYRQ